MSTDRRAANGVGPGSSPTPVPFAEVLDAIGAHVAILDERGTILAVNRAWREFALSNGVPPEDVGPGTDYLGACRRSEEAADEPSGIAVGIEDVLAGKRDSYFLEYPCHGPTSRRWFQVRVTRCELGGALRVVVAHESITETKKAEAQARRSQAELAHALRLGMMNELAAGLAHEINQPLAAIANFAAGAARRIESGDAPTEMLREALRDISAQAERAGEIVRRVRGFVRFGETRRIPASINEAVDEAVSLVRADARAAGVEIEIETDASLPDAVMDPVEIQQVVMNLVRNAVEAVSGAGTAGGVVRIETGAAMPRAVEVRVVDNGPGVTDDALRRLFDPFYTTKAAGMGIGLSLCRSIVDAHGGEMAAGRPRSGGMAFSFTVPIEQETSNDE